MSQRTRNKLSAVAWAATAFCSLWLLLSAQAAIQHAADIRPTMQHSHEDGSYISAPSN